MEEPEAEAEHEAQPEKETSAGASTPTGPPIKTVDHPTRSSFIGTLVDGR